MTTTSACFFIPTRLIERVKVLALDGHDASGKTTLARRLADEVRARYVRPFAGEVGRKLMAAYRCGDQAETLKVGTSAIYASIADASGDEAIILDRGWLTVATLVAKERFARSWGLWLPTVLLWCDERTTRARLNMRSIRAEEPNNWHHFFLEAYQDRLTLRPGPTIRTDQMNEADCLSSLLQIFAAVPENRGPLPIMHER